MSPRVNKKLVRVIERMVDNNLPLSVQHDGSFAISLNGNICARLNATEAKKACSQGLLTRHNNHQLFANAQSRTWLARQKEGDEDEAFAAQHRDMQTVDLIDPKGRIFKARKNAAESPLAWLRRRSGSSDTPFLSRAEFAAAERLRDDYARSSLAQKLCANWDAPARGSAASSPRNAVLDAADSALAAKDRFMDALNALGPGLDDIVFCLCIRESRIEGLEKARKWPKRTAKVVLKLALERLARHYGLLS